MENYSDFMIKTIEKVHCGIKIEWKVVEKTALNELYHPLIRHPETPIVSKPKNEISTEMCVSASF